MTFCTPDLERAKVLCYNSVSLAYRIRIMVLRVYLHTCTGIGVLRVLRNRGSELKSALAERTTLRTILVAGCALVSGGILLFLYSDQSLWDKGSPWQVLVGNLGGLLIASVAIALIWELAGKRAFVDEVLAKVRLSHDVSSSGLTAITHDFNRGI